MGAPHARRVRVQVSSFGYLHSPAPDAHITIDLRHALYDPHVDPAMRELTGLDRVVGEHVLNTPGATGIVGAAFLLIHAMLPGHDQRGEVLRVAFGCAGGRHRSVVLATELAGLLVTAGIGAELGHRDVLRPVVRRNGDCLAGEGR